jgi:methylmalonyl-CoA mutase
MEKLSHLTEEKSKAIAKFNFCCNNENFAEIRKKIRYLSHETQKIAKSPVFGITGTGGAGKSSLVDELVRRFLIDFPEKTYCLISVDPSKEKQAVLYLGDRIRMNSDFAIKEFICVHWQRVNQSCFVEICKRSIDVLKAAKYDLIILETSGIGQSPIQRSWIIPILHCM